jgi:hypothetical protein
MKYFIGIVLFLAVVFGIPAYAVIHGIHYQTAKGEHTGYVTAVEKSGIIWKTGTAYFKTDTSSSQEDVYCVTDEDVFNQLVETSRNKAKVTISFKDYLAKGISNCGPSFAIIDGVSEGGQ